MAAALDVDAPTSATPAATAMSSISAEVGAVDEQHAKPAHPDHIERPRITGSGAIVLPSVEVSGSGHVREKHGEHPPHPESDRSIAIRRPGEAATEPN